jgi:HEPN domain-containing protein
VRNSIVGFHCQQAVEKILKAVLSEYGVPFRRTHDLRELMDALADAGHPLPRTLASLDALTPFATLFRYEGIPAKASLDRKRTRERVGRLRAWAESRIEAAEGLF